MSRAHSPVTPASPAPRPRVLRCAAVWAAVTTLAAVGVRLCLEAATEVVDRGQHATPDEAVLLVAACVGAIACCWVWVVATSTVVDHLRGRQLRSNGLVRRLVLGACGVAVTLTALPAHAQETGVADTPSHVLDGLPLPDRATDRNPAPHSPASTPAPTATATQAPTPVSAKDSSDVAATGMDTSGQAEEPPLPEERDRPEQQSRADDNEVHVVRPGESLWAIAASTTDADADTSVPDRVRALHEHNRSVIGDDPDLIHPGQELTWPTTAPTTEVDR